MLWLVNVQKKPKKKKMWRYNKIKFEENSEERKRTDCVKEAQHSVISKSSAVWAPQEKRREGGERWGDEGRFTAAHTMAAVIYVDCWPSSVGRRGKPSLTNISCAGSQDKRQKVKTMTRLNELWPREWGAYSETNNWPVLRFTFYVLCNFMFLKTIRLRGA